jgi:hypothetical protein
MRKFIASVLFALTLLFTPVAAKAAVCDEGTTIVELQTQFKDAHQYVIEGDELKRLWEKYSTDPLPFTQVLLVQSDDNINAVHIAFDADGCGVAASIFLWDLKSMDAVLSELGINVSWAKSGA